MEKVMNRISLSFLVVFCVLLVNNAFSAQNALGGTGVGAYATTNTGEQGGLTLRTWLTPQKEAIDLYLRVALDFDAMALYGSYIQSYVDVIPGSKDIAFPLYWGPGAGVAVWSGAFGVRGGLIGGIAVAPRSLPFEVFLEGNPKIEIHFADEAYIKNEFIEARIGFRVFF
jgi:hypothetical protein